MPQIKAKKVISKATIEIIEQLEEKITDLQSETLFSDGYKESLDVSNFLT